MKNFSIATQIENDLKDFKQTRVRLASMLEVHDESVRFGRGKQSGYFFNQLETINIIDLYYSSKFQNGLRDKLGQRKIFLNVGKFRCDVASKQIELDTKDFRFIPDAYADPFTALFMQKDFHEWAKQRADDDMDDASLGDLLNKLIDYFPRYGTIVVKKVGNQIRFLPLQNLRNEQTATSLQTAAYVIEEHAGMLGSEIMAMKSNGWNLDNFVLPFNSKMNVYERYGHVPLGWLKAQAAGRGEDTTLFENRDETESVDAVVIASLTAGRDSQTPHVFYSAEIKKRPYREKHWSRQHGRWLGVGVMEDLIENQEAKNIIINLERRSLHWSSKRIAQSTTTDMVSKNLVRDVQDGEILEVGQGGQITQIDLTNKSLGEFQQFLQEWEKNADQKAFTYEANIMNQGGSRTAFRLAAFLTQAAQAYFKRKQQMIGMFMRDAILEFFVPQFLADMGDEERVVSMMNGERGFETIKAASMDLVRNEATKAALLSGKTVDVETLVSAVSPFEAARALFVKLPKAAYKNALYTFDLVATDDNDDMVDRKGDVANLTTLYQAMAATGDKRAEKVLERIAELGGIDIDSFGSDTAPAPAATPINTVQSNPLGAPPAPSGAPAKQ